MLKEVIIGESYIGIYQCKYHKLDRQEMQFPHTNCPVDIQEKLIGGYVFIAIIMETCYLISIALGDQVFGYRRS